MTNMTVSMAIEHRTAVRQFEPDYIMAVDDKRRLLGWP